MIRLLQWTLENLLLALILWTLNAEIENHERQLEQTWLQLAKYVAEVKQFCITDFDDFDDEEDDLEDFFE